MIAATGVVLFPAIVIAELRGPIFAIEGDGGGAFVVSGSETVAAIMLGFLGPSAALIGATSGSSAATWIDEPDLVAGAILAAGAGSGLD